MLLKLQITFLFFLTLYTLQAQDTTYYLQMVQYEDNPIAEKRIGKAETQFNSPLQRSNYLNNFLNDFYRDGYLAASWTKEKEENDSLFISIDIRKKIHWVILNTENTDANFLASINYKKKDFENKPFKYDEVASLMIDLLRYAENHGYPFSTVALDNIQYNDTSISANLKFQKNQFIIFDTIEIKGNLLLQANYLQLYTGLHPGEPYNQQLVKDLDNRLKEIPFASVTQKTRIEFSGDKAKVIVFLDDRKTSKFDFIIGVLPNNEITGRLIVTGEGRLDLQNIFNAGEVFKLHFSKLESTTKELQTYFAYPYLPGIPLGLEADFNLFLKDSNFLELSSSAGLLYQFGGSNNVKAFVSFYSSAILNIDTAYILSTKTLPPNLDVNERAYGLTWNYEHLNYRFNPRNGYGFSLTGSIGNKKIKQNSSILTLSDPEFPEYDFATLYDSIDESSLSIKYKYNLRYFIPFLKRNTLLLQTHGAAILSPTILQNELLRIGGNNGLRGFDDQSIPVSQYHILTAELRYLLSQNAFASLFTDIAFVENKGIGKSTVDYPYGFGAGINFETKAGIFGLDYALGSQNGNPISIKNAKIHFGYVNYF